MGLFDDFSRFLEQRLDDFLKAHPHLELQALEEQLREQEEGTLRLIADLQRQEQSLQDEILKIAKDIQRWHERASKSKAANRIDLAQAAEEREAELLRQGNQCWGQMQGIKQRIESSKELYRQVQQRRKEVQTKIAEVQASRSQAQANQPQSGETQAWNRGTTYRSPGSGADLLEKQFQQWEMDEELEQLKQQMDR
ncbi:MAG: TIGR04376 family protein [Microcoleaceae cyanobacterium]